MHIREASLADTPEIIEVLRASIGESKLPKTEKIWTYKHFDNPFGRSLILLSLEGNRIIGVRALMKWTWAFKGKEFSALRAVDTGILPEYQRQGIFKKLNTAAVEIAAREGKNFIFNTPNAKSLPGNLKMGWEKINKINIKIVPASPKRFLRRKEVTLRNIGETGGLTISENLLEEYNRNQSLKNKIYTPKSVSYLKWRYEQNALQKYEILSDSDFYLAAYVKEHRFFNELRITEHLFHNDKGYKAIRDAIHEMNKACGAEVISYSANFKLGAFQAAGRFGPVMTFRNINLEPDFLNKWRNFDNWNYTLGDLELF